ncbi:MAG: YtxH domain-containing protein [bacterium]
MARDDGGGFFMGFILGGLIGAGLALLFAPKSGEETREYLKEKALELKEKMPEVLKEGIEKGKVLVTESFEKTKALLEEKKTELKEG